MPSIEPSSTKMTSHAPIERLQRGLQLLEEEGDTPFLVVHGDDDRDPRACAQRFV